MEDQVVNKFKKAVSAVVDASRRPAECWRLLRQAVRELHVVLKGATTIVAEFEARLDRLEAAATGRPSPAAAAAPHPAAAKKASTRSSAARKAPRKSAARKRSDPS